MLTAKKTETVKKLVEQLATLWDEGEAMESKELLSYYGWMKDFKPSRALKNIRNQEARCLRQLEKMAKASEAAAWDATVKALNIAPECYSHEALTEY